MADPIRLWALGSGLLASSPTPKPNAHEPALALLGVEHRALCIVPFFRGPRPRVFAHRGGCALGPENTIAAFDRGLAAGADGLELDVRLSADGMVVVCHDETLDRTTDGSGPVSTKTAAELSRVDAGYHFTDAAGKHPFRGCGVGVPTLRAVLERYPNALMIVEMKPDTAEMASAVVAEIRRAGAVDRVCAAGYGSRSLAAARETLPEMASSASRTEVRLALYRSWAALAGLATGVRRISSARTCRHAAHRLAPVHPSRPSCGSRRAGVDRR